jgi:hypothetical protein
MYKKNKHAYVQWNDFRSWAKAMNIRSTLQMPLQQKTSCSWWVLQSPQLFGSLYGNETSNEVARLNDQWVSASMLSAAKRE